jgi:hypothetical protein
MALTIGDQRLKIHSTLVILKLALPDLCMHEL